MKLSRLVVLLPLALVGATTSASAYAAPGFFGHRPPAHPSKHKKGAEPNLGPARLLPKLLRRAA